jgi:hypothetical protein
MTEIVAAVLALFGTLVTVTVTAYVTAAKVRRDLESEYDISLRTDRLAAYRELWKSLQPLAKYARPGPVTYRQVGSLIGELRAWYFQTGGIFLSYGARDSYFELMDELRDVLATAPPDPSEELEPVAFEALRELGSDLRTAMVEDVQTRRTSALARG